MCHLLLLLFLSNCFFDLSCPSSFFFRVQQFVNRYVITVHRTADCLQPIYARERKSGRKPTSFPGSSLYLSPTCLPFFAGLRFSPNSLRAFNDQNTRKSEGCEQSIPRGITIHFCHQHTITMTNNSLTLHKQKLRLNICRFLETQFSNFNLHFFYYITEEAYRG